MVTLLIYDIPDDRGRSKVADACLDCGLQRIQWSAFVGDLPSAKRSDLRARIERIMKGREGNVQLYPICEKDFAAVEEMVYGDYKFGVKERIAERKKAVIV
ncbi:MAG: CRISPR-associated endonuclease Cas2 [Bacteroidota bacterium]